MKVLSLFDGFSCGQLALEQAGISHDGYYASEIDKYAMKVANALYPDTTKLGDINNWESWDIDWGEIGLIMAGSPCQGFSFAGKQLAFDDPRSKLFFVFVDIVNFVRSINPDVKVLLENVKMKKEYKQVITEKMGVDYVEINSALVSAQNRKRLYWANWEFGQPKDLGIMLKDVLEDGDEEYFKGEALKGGHLDWWNKNKEFQLAKKYSALDPDKAITMTARQYASWNGNFVELPAALTERRTEEAKRIRRESMREQGRDFSPRRAKELVPRTDGKMNCLTATYSMKEHVVMVQRPRGKNGGGLKALDRKSPTLSANSWEHNNHLMMDKMLRKLTPRECARLQTIPEDKIDVMLSCGVSNSQLYKMLGNGWTVSVIAHILREGRLT